MTETEKRAFITGAAMMRTMLANFVEHDGHAVLAHSMRLNWIPSWGENPPVLSVVSEVEEAINSTDKCCVCEKVVNQEDMLVVCERQEKFVCSQSCASSWFDARRS